MADYVKQLRKLNDSLLTTGSDYSDILLGAASEIEHNKEKLTSAINCQSEAWAKDVNRLRSEINELKTTIQNFSGVLYQLRVSAWTNDWDQFDSVIEKALDECHV